MIKKFSVYGLCFLIAVITCSCMVKSFNPDSENALAPTKGYGALSNFPFKEAWYGIYFQEDKIGYSHFKIQPAGKNFVIDCDSTMRLTAMKKTNEINMNEKITVAPDLSLLSFDSDVKMNQKSLKIEGKLESTKLLLKMNVDSEKVEREFPVNGKIFHTSAISLMPALRGLKEGSKNSFNVFNVERQSIESIEQEIAAVKGSPGPSDAVWRVTNNYGLSTVNSWLNRKGMVVLEKALDGSLITILEDEAAARQFLEKRAKQKDLILDFSLVKSPRRIINPHKTQFLKIRLQGTRSNLIARDHRQNVNDSKSGGLQEGFDVEVQVEDIQRFKDGRDLTGAHITSKDSAGNLSNYLVSTPAIQSGHKEIRDQAQEIVSKDLTDLDKVVKLVNWTADNIKGSMKDSFSALEVLRSKEGECQSHTQLYTALARSIGIPTRIVTGLVYSDNLGFLYHSWAESYVRGWLSVDPTLRQVPSDATHIKLASANEDDASPVLKMMGKVLIQSVEYR
ncbi:MAG: transglutaminase-like domain-containing protein [Deltaproteobacteria bacterium]|nr:transglutaminase-like domain-containing protein [Deltaproteobacteria bacterium]